MVTVLTLTNAASVGDMMMCKWRRLRKSNYEQPPPCCDHVSCAVRANRGRIRRGPHTVGAPMTTRDEEIFVIAMMAGLLMLAAGIIILAVCALT
jgi:hypothetical protein